MTQHMDIIQVGKRKYIDWQKLEAEFIANEEIPYATTWLRETIGWDSSRLNAGNTIKHIQSWGKKRAEYRQKILAEKTQQARDALEFLTPEIIQAKRDIILSYLEVLKKGVLHRREVTSYENVKGIKKPVEKVEIIEWYQPLSLRDRSHILTKLKTELGEPAVITKNKNEDTVSFNSVEALLEAYGIKADGELLLDDSLTKDSSSQG